MVPCKVFLVEAHVRRRIASMPFGRFEVGDEDLVVRSWLLPLIKPLSVRKESVIEISVYRRLNLYRLRVKDSEAIFSEVSLALPYSADSMVRELKRRAYPVVDLRKGTRQQHSKRVEAARCCN